MDGIVQFIATCLISEAFEKSIFETLGKIYYFKWNCFDPTANRIIISEWRATQACPYS
jgi:hypothetical protein